MAPGVRYHRKATHAGQHENWLRPACARLLPDLTIAFGNAAGWWRMGLRLVESTQNKVNSVVTLKKLGSAVFWELRSLFRKSASVATPTPLPPVTNYTTADGSHFHLCCEPARLIGQDCHRKAVKPLVRRYQLSSKPELSNFSVRQFSVAVRTILSGAPAGISASISNVASQVLRRCTTPRRRAWWAYRSSLSPPGPPPFGHG
jgi:hypothetical protein